MTALQEFRDASKRSFPIVYRALRDVGAKSSGKKLDKERVLARIRQIVEGTAE